MKLECRLKELNLYYPEGRKKRDDMMYAFKIVDGPPEARDNNEALGQIRRKETIRVKEETIVRHHVLAGLRSKSFAIRVLNGWGNLPKEVAEVESVNEFKRRLDNIQFPEYLGDII